jgi:hypothetical protein
MQKRRGEGGGGSTPQNLFPEFTLLTFLPTAVFNVLTFGHKG